MPSSAVADMAARSSARKASLLSSVNQELGAAGVSSDSLGAADAGCGSSGAAAAPRGSRCDRKVWLPRGALSTKGWAGAGAALAAAGCIDGIGASCFMRRDLRECRTQACGYFGSSTGRPPLAPPDPTAGLPRPGPPGAGFGGGVSVPPVTIGGSLHRTQYGASD